MLVTHPRRHLPALPCGHRSRADAAAAFLRKDAARRRVVTYSYRSHGAPPSVYRREPDLAVLVEQDHARGTALDLGCGAARFGSGTYRWLTANAGCSGSSHPAGEHR